MAPPPPATRSSSSTDRVDQKTDRRPPGAPTPERLAITVTHFPPGTSKWNKIEHRLFSQISMNWRGRPLEDYETVVQLIGATTTKTGLKVSARLDRRRYRTAIKVTDEIMRTLNLSPASFHGEWNYKITPCLSK